ncbi:MAG: tRNA (adenosine(37)-N6)-dimethylallyltransferase MiaA [Bacteroidetes bacterium]|nr:tRNA (adenosine(37)-N6)-dimethylallyltransferase MiaA [Bacteroidota bacterium]
MVGGTAQYIYAVVDNWSIPKVAEDKKFREKLESRIEKSGLESVYQELIKKDPKAAEFVQKDNPRRIIRALEVIEKTGIKFSETRKKNEPKYNAILIGNDMTREALYKKIDQRIDQMIKVGLVDEVKALLSKYPADSSGFQTIGYQEIIAYLNNETRLDEAIEKIKFHSHRYVRHQYNWFSSRGGSASGGKKDKRINWIKSYDEAKELLVKFIL